MPKNYVQYVVPCVDEGIGVLTGFIETAPTACPHNNTHTIEPTGIRPVATITEKIVTINQDSIEIGGYFRTDFYSIQAPANTVTTKDIVYPYNITIYLATYLGTNTNIGDSMSVYVAPGLTCGPLDTDIIAGATSLTLSSIYSVLSNGFLATISDGINTDDLGEITSVDQITKTIHFSAATTHDFAQGSIVKISIPRVKNCVFVNDNTFTLGSRKMESSGLPAGAKIRFIYTNNSNVDKTFNFYLEIGY